MRKFALLFLLVGLCALPSLAADTFKNAPVVDVNCSKKVAADPDSHTRESALLSALLVVLASLRRTINS